jgi:hypothetical protein
METMNEPFPWIGIMFWLGVFSWLGIKVWSRYRIEQERQKTLRAFAERGTPLDKEMMQKLYPAVGQGSGGWKQSPDAVARGLVVAGVVCLFLGIGNFVGAIFLGQIAREAMLGVSAGGAILGCLGLGLITSGWALRRMRARHKEQPSAAGEDIQ